MTKILKISLVKSIIGRPEKHRKILKNIGLIKLNRVIEFKSTPAVKKMIKKISHLINIEEVDLNEAS